MKTIVISESSIVRSGIFRILENEKIIRDISDSKDYNDIYKLGYDLIIIDINKNNAKYLNDIASIRSIYNTKIMVLDFYEDKSLFFKCMQLGIDGFILANIDSESLKYAVRQIAKNKKYHDSRLMETYLYNNEKSSIDSLTKREKEILLLIAEGKSNMEISQKLFIAENTVKKHTSSVLSKLNLKDRTQAAVYVHNNRNLYL